MCKLRGRFFVVLCVGWTSRPLSGLGSVVGFWRFCLCVSVGMCVFLVGLSYSNFSLPVLLAYSSPVVDKDGRLSFSTMGHPETPSPAPAEDVLCQTAILSPQRRKRAPLQRLISCKPHLWSAKLSTTTLLTDTGKIVNVQALDRA